MPNVEEEAAAQDAHKGGSMSANRIRGIERTGLRRRSFERGRLSWIAWRAGWLALAIALIGLAFAAVADDLLQVGEHVFEFRGVTYNSDGTSTWDYTVTSGRKPSLSHWVLEWDPSILGPGNVVYCSEQHEVGTDPKTHVYGLKFDGGYTGNESRDVTFTLDGWYEVTSTRVGVKAGKNTEVEGPISGPGGELEPENVPPTAVDDAASTGENDSVQVDVLANDSDEGGAINRTMVTITQAPVSGSADVDPTTGVVTYTPYAGACGDDSFDYTVEDNDGAVSNEARVAVLVVCNKAPEANDDDLVTTDEYTAVAVNVVANDRDSDGVLDLGSISISRDPVFGSLSVHPTAGVVTYTPVVGGCGDDSFEYAVQDDDGATSNPATVTVSVLCTDPPLAIDDFYNVEEGGTLSIPTAGILANDQETPGKPLAAILVSDVQNGVLALSTDGSFVYVHDGTETREDAFTYLASDTSKESNVATVNLAVAPTNDTPAAADDEAETDEDFPVTIDVLANDSDPDEDALAVDWTSAPAHGTVSNLGTAVQYAPGPDFHGTDTFAYAASDGRGGTSVATVTVSVAAVNDDPLAQADTGSTEEDVALEVGVLSNDSDPDGDSLAIESVTQGENGSVAEGGTGVIYTPNADFFGTDTFTYTISDGAGGTSSAVVTVVVAPVNDAPQALGGAVSTDEDTALDIEVMANDSDPDGDLLTLDSVTQPSHGTVMATGNVATYAPAAGFHGEDSFTYTISDGRGGTSTSTIRITVVPVNDTPLVEDDGAFTDEDIAVTIAVLANDSDPDGDTLTITSVTRPAHGEVADDGTRITYTPDADFHGVETFEYTAADGFGATASAVVMVSVSSVNDVPAAHDDVVVTDEDVEAVVLALANDSDPDGDALTVASVAQAQSGVAAKSGDAVTYTANPDFYGEDFFTYTISDGHGGASSATVRITVVPANDDPVAQADSASTDEDIAVEILVLANDSDPEGDILAIDSVTRPANGSVAASATSLVYTPNANFRGVDTFEYTVSDGLGGVASAAVTVAVAAVNDDPVARDDAAATNEDEAVAILVLDNDEDADGDVLSIQSVTHPGHGAVTTAGATATYAPAPGFHGEDSFTYTISDGRGGTSTATISITVVPVNDAPVAEDDSAFTDEDLAVTISVLANDSDVDGDALAIQAVTSPTRGTAEIRGATVVYTPSAGFSGIDGFTYVVADGQGGAATATVTVNVATVNHPPMARGGSVTTDEDVAITIAVLENDADPDGDALTLQSVTQPTHGSLTRSRTTVAYAPDSGFYGDDAFTYTISDGRGGTSSATITITVTEVNDPPTARDDSASTKEDATVAILVLANDSDPDGDLLTVESASSPAHGDVAISGSAIVYAPAPDFHGVDSFTYTVGDGRGGLSSASVTVYVADVNDVPVAGDDDVSTLEDVPATVLVLANDTDPDGDPMTIESNSTPLHGVATRTGTSIVYTPTANYSGEDSFTYTVTDGNGGTATGTVTVTVVEANDFPVAQDDFAMTSEGTAAAIEVLGNDHDLDGDLLAIQAVTQPAHGAVSNGGTELTYTPDDGFSGTDTFSYTLSDGRGGSDTAQVSVTVTHVNHAPLAQDDSASTTGGAVLTIYILQNDSDPDGDFLLVQSIGTPAHGTALNGRTSITYIPDDGFVGIDTFSYMVSDGSGGAATAFVTVSVAAANQPPVASDDSGVTDEDLPVTIAVLMNDVDPDGEDLRIESIARPSSGSAVREGGLVTYSPAEGWSGVDTFTYTVSDGRGGTATASVMVAVIAVNDAPTAQDDSATTDMETAVSIPVLLNDSDEESAALTITSVAHGQNGMVFNAGTELVYTPDPGFVGTDSFTYTVTDGDGLTSTATVTVGVAGVAGAGGAAIGDALGSRVIISEVAWAGTAANAQDEWIELRNLGSEPVDLAGWSVQWRRTRPVAPEDYVWKVVELSGTLAAAGDLPAGPETDTSGVSVRVDDPSGLWWRVSYDPDRDTRGYFLLERTRDDVVKDVSSSMLYDANRSPTLALSDLGEVIVLVNARGGVVDTANAANVGRDAWAGGSQSTFGSMERIDPFGPDVAENWSTNAGVVTRGEDAQRRPLRATPGTRNAPRLETLYQRGVVQTVALRAGGPLAVSFSLSRGDRKLTGWPWVVTTRPGLDLAAGASGGLDVSTCSFSGQARPGNEYVLDIRTSGMSPGVVLFWIVYGKGEALLVPVRITP
jgi:hypothetical protein